MATHDKVARAHVDLVDGLRFTVSFPEIPGAVPIVIDEEPPAGGGTGPNPTALLAASIGSCLAASLVFCLGRARLTPANVSADVRAHVVRNDAGRFRVDGVNVALAVEIADADDPRLQRCRELFEDFCIVTQSVRTGIPVDVQLSMHAAETLAES